MALPHAILFDHDGTLVNSERVHLTLWRQVLANYDCQLDEALYSQMMAGVPTHQNAIDAVAHFALDADPEELVRAKMDKLSAFLHHQAFPLFPGVKEVITRAHRLNIPMAIVTGGARESVERTIEVYQLERKIVCVIATEDVTRNKPDPECYMKAIDTLGIHHKTACAVEDTHAGLVAATSAGLPCDVVPTGLSTYQDFSLARNRYSSLQEWASVVLKE